jgi:hypothetical protein
MRFLQITMIRLSCDAEAVDVLIQFMQFQFIVGRVIHYRAQFALTDSDAIYRFV